jgi:hypothetical protein
MRLQQLAQDVPREVFVVNDQSAKVLPTFGGQ